MRTMRSISSHYRKRRCGPSFRGGPRCHYEILQQQQAHLGLHVSSASYYPSPCDTMDGPLKTPIRNYYLGTHFSMLSYSYPK